MFAATMGLARHSKSLSTNKQNKLVQDAEFCATHFVVKTIVLLMLFILPTVVHLKVALIGVAVFSINYFLTFGITMNLLTLSFVLPKKSTTVLRKYFLKCVLGPELVSE